MKCQLLCCCSCHLITLICGLALTESGVIGVLGIIRNHIRRKNSTMPAWQDIHYTPEHIRKIVNVVSLFLLQIYFSKCWHALGETELSWNWAENLFQEKHTEPYPEIKNSFCTPLIAISFHMLFSVVQQYCCFCHWTDKCCLLWWSRSHWREGCTSKRGAEVCM